MAWPATPLQPRWRRAIDGAYYLCFTTAGLVGLMAPSQAVLDASPAWASTLWGAFYLLGGVACLWAVLRHRRGGELLGLPLCGAASALYAVALVGQALHSGVVTYLIAAALLLGQALVTVDRWVTVREIVALLQPRGDAS